MNPKREINELDNFSASVRSLLPDECHLPALLELKNSGDADQQVSQWISSQLLYPVDELLKRPAKNFRGQLVELGYRLCDSDGHPGPEKIICETFAQVIEALHAGSLIVDDIQDGSRTRRGAPSLHIQHGIPIALNAGNWLYFWAVRKVRNLELDPSQELRAYRLIQDVLLRAHFGQALDVGVRVDAVPQEQVHPLCIASMELKSGALMALGLCLGATAAGGSPEQLHFLNAFGHRFGIALQMFDDIGNLASLPAEAVHRSSFEYTKRLEDLILKRPSWIWAVAASDFSARDYATFSTAVDRLPDESFLNPWLALHDFIPLARRKAREYLEQTLQQLESETERTGNGMRKAAVHLGLRDLAEKVATSYG